MRSLHAATCPEATQTTCSTLSLHIGASSLNLQFNIEEFLALLTRHQFIFIDGSVARLVGQFNAIWAIC